MKKVIMILMVAALALPIMAQQQDWQSTSSLKTSGSTYTPQVTEVGASNPGSVGTPYSPSNAPGRPFKAPDPISTEDQRQENEGGSGLGTPLGDAVLPLTLMALAYALVVYFRRRKQTLKG